MTSIEMRQRPQQQESQSHFASEPGPSIGDTQKAEDATEISDATTITNLNRWNTKMGHLTVGLLAYSILATGAYTGTAIALGRYRNRSCQVSQSLDNSCRFTSTAPSIDVPTATQSVETVTSTVYKYIPKSTVTPQIESGTLGGETRWTTPGDPPETSVAATLGDLHVPSSTLPGPPRI
ncbi:hypothetical protein IAT40_005238 [Kwoniella sp. CBS 6097]